MRGDQGALVQGPCLGDLGDAMAQRHKGGRVPIRITPCSFLQNNPGRLNRQDVSVQYGDTPGGEVNVSITQKAFQTDQVIVQGRRWCLLKRHKELPDFADQFIGWHWKFMFPTELIRKDGPLLGICEILPGGCGNQKGEPIRQGGIQWFGPKIELLINVQVIRAWRRVHRRPPIAQAFQSDSLHTALMDDGEQLVLQFRAGAVDFVDEHHLRIPDGGFSGDVTEAALIIGRHRDTHQVIVIDQAGIVEAVIQFQGLGQAFQQKTLGRAMPPDEQQRILAGQGGKHHGFQVRPTLQP